MRREGPPPPLHVAPEEVRRERLPEGRPADLLPLDSISTFSPLGQRGKPGEAEPDRSVGDDGPFCRSPSPSLRRSLPRRPAGAPTMGRAQRPSPVSARQPAQTGATAGSRCGQGNLPPRRRRRQRGEYVLMPPPSPRGMALEVQEHLSVARPAGTPLMEHSDTDFLPYEGSAKPRRTTSLQESPCSSRGGSGLATTRRRSEPDRRPSP